jgi:acetylornithine deacetylase/succinyl-diaminopimelate desuccinylase-like protein
MPILPDSPFGRECIEVFQRLVQFDTSNPPGNETPAQKYIADLLRREGFSPDIIESAPSRGNLICRWEGTDPSAPSLLVASHMDVVPADAKAWEQPPFSGKISEVNGIPFIWGRGAMDCKNTVLSEVMAIIQLKRNGFRPRGTIILLVEADEEQMGAYGVDFVINKHFDQVKTEFVINEGGGVQVPIGKKLQYVLQTSEKGTMWTKLRVRGVSGHASIQTSSANNALLKMMEILTNIQRHRKKIVVVDEYRLMATGLQLSGFVKRLLTSRRLLPLTMKLAAKLYGNLALAFIGSLVTNTINPTMITASNKENVVPDVCECVLDIRVLPGMDRAATDAMLRDMIGKKYVKEVEIIPLENGVASASPTGTLCYQRIEQALQVVKPGALPSMPLFMAGATDNRYFRYKNIPAYGFSLLSMDQEMNYDLYSTMIHGVNERISVTNLLESVDFFLEFLKLW